MKTSAGLSWPWLFLTSLLLTAARGDYRLEIRLEEYHNPHHLQADGSYCNWDLRSHRCRPCRNRFAICVQFDTAVGLSDIHDYSLICDSLPHYATGVVGRGAHAGSSSQDSDNLYFSEEGYIDEQNNISNPLVFVGNEAWPGKFQLVVKIINRISLFHEYLVDLIAEEWKLPVGGEFVQRSLNGFKFHSNLVVSARVFCSHRMLCQNCTRVCESPLFTEEPGGDRSKSQGHDGYSDGDANTGGDSNGEMSPLPTAFDSPLPSAPLVGSNSSEDALQSIAEGNATSPQSNQQSLAISLSMSIVLLFLLLLLVATIVLCACVRRRRRKNFRGERRPFLRRHSSINAGRAGGYTGLPTDDESGEEYTGSNLYQPLPDMARTQYRPHLSTTGEDQDSDEDNTGTSVRTWTMPVWSEYSIIRRQDLLSPAQSLEDIPEEDEEEYDSDLSEDIQEAGYSVIRREDMGDASCASGATGGEREEGQREEVEDMNRHSGSVGSGDSTAAWKGHSVEERGIERTEYRDTEEGVGKPDRDSEEHATCVGGQADSPGRPRMPTPPHHHT